MAILLKTALVRVSSIQIMQVRIQNKGKSVWKIRWRSINLNLCLHRGVGRGILVGYEQQLVEGCRLVAEESVLEVDALSAPGSEVFDGLVHSLAGVVELGPSREVVAGRLIGPLDAEGELARLGKPLVGAGEVANASVKSTQLLMLRGFRLFNHVWAVPWSMSGTYFTAARLLPFAMLTAVE